MSETLSYIESYFENQLTPEERLGFEQRIKADENFAQAVAFYVLARQATRKTLLQQKQKEWAQKETKVKDVPVVEIKQATNWKRILSIAASIALMVSVAWMFFLNKKDSPQELAAQYAEQHFNTLSGAMDGGRDSLQLGIAAYNRKDFNIAEKLFTGVYTFHPDQTDALKYNGLVSLAQKDYDKAISHFQMLAGLELHANPGLFYQAIALLQRNKPGDEEQARKLLQTVVDTRQEGFQEAQEWLKI